ncbi:hypothetical protein DXG01_015776 [Tephrocybe rancida]|nr:hypothetical protein DXG01_015776 [Tephrocybe rancida]
MEGAVTEEAEVWKEEMEVGVVEEEMTMEMATEKLIAWLKELQPTPTRRSNGNSILYPEKDDGPIVVDQILRTIPSEWAQSFNSADCPDIFELLAKVGHLGKSLISTWELMEVTQEHMENHMPYRSNRRPFRPHSNTPKREAHVAQVPLEGEPESVDEESASGASEESKEQEVHIVHSRQHGGSSTSPVAKAKKPWPKGQTIDGYMFLRDDSVKSAKQPNRLCYICTSPFHFANDCSHHGRWMVMRNANMIHVKLSPEEKATCDREYLAMLAEIETSSSACLPNPPEYSFSKLEAEDELLSKETPEDYWKTIAERPPIKEGIQMKLYQLTGQAKVLGYVQMQLFMTTIDGTIASFDLEVYVVRGMRVPLLLGEDFSTPYELGME